MDGGEPPGVVKQQVQVQTGAMATGTTLVPVDNTIPQITEGDEYMTLAVTPRSGGSILKIDVVITLSHSVGSQQMVAALFQDAGADALAVGPTLSGAATGWITINFSHRIASVSTAARTFRVRAGSNGAGTTTFNGISGTARLGGVIASSITITEIEG